MCGCRPQFSSALQWHIDGAFWNTLPPAVSCLRCVEAPEPRTIIMSVSLDETAEPLVLTAGATAYVSGVTAYLLRGKISAIQILRVTPVLGSISDRRISRSRYKCGTMDVLYQYIETPLFVAENQYQLRGVCSLCII